MKLAQLAAPLLFLLALTPARAQEGATAPQACARLVARALVLTGEKIVCEPGVAGLTLKNVSAKGLQSLRVADIRDGRYLGFTIAGDDAAPAPVVAATVNEAQAAKLLAAQARLADVPAVNFDNGAKCSELNGYDLPLVVSGLSGRERVTDAVADTVKGFKLLPAGGPPGSGAPQNDDEQEPVVPRRGGPPGSGEPQQTTPRRGGPPGSTDPQQDPSRRTGPPGTGNVPGGQVPPGGSVPPSRPAPVWRSNFPAPAPNWWNTDFNSYNWWQQLPQGYDRPYKDTSNPDTFYYYSGWYRWRDVFVTNWEHTEDTASLTRNAATQNQVNTRSLTSESYRDVKECYYQAVYRYDWTQGGFYGSHWEENFDHYKASCIRLPREYGQPRVFTSNISFDMSQTSGQDLPWETDKIIIRYDGQGTARYDFSGASYKYSIRTDNQRPGSESLTFVAGPKILRAPEADKVQAFLRNNGGKIELVINDDRASFYQGETLRVNVKVVRRVVIKVKGLLWGWNEKNVDSTIWSSPVDVLTDAGTPQNVTDLTGAANGPKPANFVRSSVYIESWEFSRVNSKISTAAVVRKGQGNAISN